MALIVKKSKLPNAGKGLFTTKAIAKGEKVIEYKGEIIEWKEYSKRVEQNKDGYLFYISKKRCIDAFPTPQYKARYANDANGLSKVSGLKNNAQYEVEDEKCFIVTTRDIKAGEEIFVDYSKDYWNCVRYNIRLKERQDKEKEKEKKKTKK